MLVSLLVIEFIIELNIINNEKCEILINKVLFLLIYTLDLIDCIKSIFIIYAYFFIFTELL